MRVRKSEKPKDGATQKELNTADVFLEIVRMLEGLPEPNDRRRILEALAAYFDVEI